MTYRYDPDVDVLIWEAEEPRPSPVSGVTTRDYQEALFWIRRARRLSPIDLVEENVERVDRFSNMKRTS